MKNRFRFSINVKLVILALLIVFLVFRPVSSRQVSDTVQYDFSSYFTCQDGTFRGSCSGQRYCGTEELIVNNGFETVQNGNPFGFTKHGTDVSHVNDPTEAYQGNYYSISTGKYSSFAQDIKLKTRQDYSFVAYIKGDCDYVTLYYTDEDGVNHNFNYEMRGYYWYWKAQPEWVPVTMDFFLRQSILSDIKLDDFRLECAENKTLMVDSMHLEKSDENQLSKLIDNCGFCGCTDNETCGLAGACELSAEAHNEMFMNCVLDCDWALCDEAPDSARKRVAMEQFAITCDDVNKCPAGLCAQKVVYFDCLDSGEDCNEEILSGYEVNPDFLSGRQIFIRDNTENELKRYQFNGDNSNKNKCDILIQHRYPSGFGWASRLHLSTDVNYGTIIDHADGNSFSDYFNEEPYYRSEKCRDATSFCEQVMYSTFGTTIDYKKDCNGFDCQLLRYLDGQEQPNGRSTVIGPKADILCGYDDRWYLCDRDGIRDFTNGERFLCLGDSGTWVKLS